MLVLSRQIDEEIVIGEGQQQVVITVVDISRGFKVRIGIDAHPSIPVHRREVYEAIQRKKGRP